MGWGLILLIAVYPANIYWHLMKFRNRQLEYPHLYIMGKTTHSVFGH